MCASLQYIKTARKKVLVVFLTQQSSRFFFSTNAKMAQKAQTQSGMKMTPQQAYDAKMVKESKGDNDNKKKGENDKKEKSNNDKPEKSNNANLQKSDDGNIQKSDNGNKKRLQL